jgi:hypothetical protein
MATAIRMALEAAPAALASEVGHGQVAIDVSKLLSSYVEPYLAHALGANKLTEKTLDSYCARNKIMHMHNNERATQDQCSRFIELANKLFDLDYHINLEY